MKLLFVFGTRPEAIKLAPVILELRSRPEVTVRVCVTAQHRQMLDQVLQVFDLVPDADLDVMAPGQDLTQVTTRILQGLAPLLSREQPDWVVVHGDTTTTFAASLAAFYQQIPVAHVEAGLRTHQRYSPFPEELNRRLTGALASLHLAPTTGARANLLAEAVAEQDVVVTGNTVVDALQWVLQRIDLHPPALPVDDLPAAVPVVVITGHRRENFGVGMQAICGAIAELAKRHPATVFVYPVHLNPNVREPVQSLLAGYGNIRLIEPLEYLPFVALMRRACLILSDSGGIQEEAPTLQRPVLLLREVTERPEGIASGYIELVGVDQQRIVQRADSLLRLGWSMPDIGNPFGDGRASVRIADALLARRKY